MKLFLTNIPSFYKIEQYNRIDAKERIFVVFTSRDLMDSGRNQDFISGEMRFEHLFLPAKASLASRMRTILGLLRKKRFDEVIVSGWDCWENILTLFLSARRKNSFVCESSVYESATTGWKGLFKRFLCRRFRKVYCPGASQADLFRRLAFKGQVIRTGGCGILNYVPQPPFVPKEVVKRFLYVGRLVPVKNLEMLVEAFRYFPDLELTIVGEGVLEDSLKRMAGKNVRFTGYVNNRDLPQCYASHDVFVLPSVSEVWGLVVEEALNNGLPVIVSDRVGCHEDLVGSDHGLVFKADDASSLQDAIARMTEVDRYNRFREAVSRMDFAVRAERQVSSFLSVREL